MMVTPPTLQIDRSLWRSLRIFDGDRLRWLDEAASMGPLAALKFGPVKAWVVTDAEIARTILVTEADRWRRPISALVPIRMGVGENLFTQTDKHWATLQPALLPAFRKKTLASRLAELPALIESHTSQIRHHEEIDLERLTNRIALAVAAYVLFDEHIDHQRADEIAWHQSMVVGWVGERLGQVRSAVPFAVGGKARAMRVHRRALEAFADETIQHGKNRSASTEDVLGALLAARPNGSPLSDSQLRSHVLGLLFAGNETTAAALAWALVNGAQNPAAWSALRADEGLAPLFAAETLRLTPAVWGFARQANQKSGTLSLGNVSTSVSRTEVVTVYLRGMNRNAAVWPDPTTFRPERHSETSSEQHRSLLPFGLGPRMCIGQHLAIAEIHAALPALARSGMITLSSDPVPDSQFALRFVGGLKGTFS